MCVLVSREVLTAAADDDLEVQHLTFSLPDAHTTMRGPSAHVKVRAPDAVGQTGRVRAYSAEHDAAAHEFALTVKIYPGGPPASRGTSRHLGNLRVGDSLHVLQTRTMPWPASRPARVGMVAFGVGVAEMLEPAEALLAQGSTVALLYAARTRRALLYRRRLCALLEAFPHSFRVRYAISRAGSGVEESATDAAGCAAERFGIGRIDARLVASEFGSWRAAGSADAPLLAEERETEQSVGVVTGVEPPRFLVVGTRTMEHEAWGWLHTLGFRGRLLSGDAWRPLVAPPPEPPGVCEADTHR